MLVCLFVQYIYHPYMFVINVLLSVRGYVLFVTLSHIKSLSSCYTNKFQIDPKFPNSKMWNSCYVLWGTSIYVLLSKPHDLKGGKLFLPNYALSLITSITFNNTGCTNVFFNPVLYTTFINSNLSQFKQLKKSIIHKSVNSTQLK